MDESYPLCSLMVVHSLDVKNHPFLPRVDDEDILDHKVSFLSVVEALLYFSK